MTEQYTSGGVVAYIALYQNVMGSILESFVWSTRGPTYYIFVVKTSHFLNDNVSKTLFKGVSMVESNWKHSWSQVDAITTWSYGMTLEWISSPPLVAAVLIIKGDESPGSSRMGVIGALVLFSIWGRSG